MLCGQCLRRKYKPFERTSLSRVTGVLRCYEDMTQIKVPVVPFEIRYSMPWRNTLIPHLHVWGPSALLVIANAIVGVCLVIAFSVYPQFRTLKMGISVFFTLLLGWLSRGFFFGLWNGLRPGSLDLVLRVEENGIGFGKEKVQYWVFLDGVRQVEEFRDGVLTIVHHNGSVFHIPRAALTEEQIDFVKMKIQRAIV